MAFSGGVKQLDVDLHGMNLYQARIALAGAFKRATAADYRMRVIHGYRQGSAVKDMVLNEFSRHPSVLRIENTMNPGETVFVLRELTS